MSEQAKTKDAVQPRVLGIRPKLASDAEKKVKTDIVLKGSRKAPEAKKKVKTVAVQKEKTPKSFKEAFAALIGSEVGANLNMQQKLFCELYGGSREHYGKGTDSYIDAYGMKVNRELMKYSYSTLPTLDPNEEITPLEAIRRAELEEKIRLGTIEKNKYDVASQSASRLLRSVKIVEYVNVCRQAFIDDNFVDFEIGKVAAQDGDTDNKMKALALHAKLRGRLIDKKEETHKHIFAGVIRHLYDSAEGINKTNGSQTP